MSRRMLTFALISACPYLTQDVCALEDISIFNKLKLHQHMEEIQNKLGRILSVGNNYFKIKDAEYIVFFDTDFQLIYKSVKYTIESNASNSSLFDYIHHHPGCNSAHLSVKNYISTALSSIEANWRVDDTRNYVSFSQSLGGRIFVSCGSYLESYYHQPNFFDRSTKNNRF